MYIREEERKRKRDLKLTHNLVPASKHTYIHVLCCFALFVCLTLLVSLRSTYSHTFTHSHLSLVPSSLGLRLHAPGPSVGGLSPGSHTSTQEASPSSCGRGEGRTWLPATLTHTHSTPLTAGTPVSSSLWGSQRDDQTTAGSSGSPAAAGKPWQQHDTRYIELGTGLSTTSNQLS